jgi:hypothetical protein
LAKKQLSPQEVNSQKRLKKRLGSFYTTEASYVLSGMSVPDNVPLIEPFVGGKDLIKWAGKKMEMYDNDRRVCEKDSEILFQDTLLNPPVYKDKFVVTNPPYLARNKNKDKTLYDKYDTNDLYKVFIKNIVDGDVSGGILILPLNFLSGQDNKIRNYFFNKYKISQLNIFEETVFGDTSNVVCAFQFERGTQDDTLVNLCLYPSKEARQISLQRKYGYRLAGEVYDVVIRMKNSEFKISRLVKGEKYLERDKREKFIPTNLFLCASDSGGEEKARIKKGLPVNIKDENIKHKISLTVCKHRYYGKETDRMFASLSCSHALNNQQEVADRFNKRLEKYRKKYNSLFLTNFRNSSKSYSRKRISFSLAFSIIKEILEEMEEEQNER